jgi:pullulanase-type alpha-1,6-glucosidase
MPDQHPKVTRIVGIFMILMLALLMVPAFFVPVAADHTPDPASVAIVGSLQSELGCPGDWQPECATTELAYDADDDVWQKSFDVPTGNWEYKAALNDSWDENYGAGGALNGANISLSLADPQDVKFYYDHKSHWITDNVNSAIATAAGSFQSELGCTGDWQPDCLRSWLQDPDGDGIYAFVTTAIPAGNYEFKVALDEDWAESYPNNNVNLNVPADGDTVTVTWNSANNEVVVDVGSTEPPPDPEWVVAGNFQDDLPISASCGEWNNTCAQTGMEDDDGDGVYRFVGDALPAGSYDYKIVEFDNWGNAHPADDVSFNATGAQMRWYFQPGPNRVADNANQCIATVAGNFQSELGGDNWTPSNLRTMMWQEAPGSDWYSFTTSLPAGNWEYKVARNEAWNESYPADNVPLNLAATRMVTFRYNCATNAVEHSLSGGLDPGDEALVTDPLRQAGIDEFIYFVMTDRFANGDPANDRGGSPSSDREIHGFDPTDKGFYHGGDLAGLESKLDYLDDLGVTALWITPPFTNRWVQGAGTPDVSAAYHGYWQIDLTQIDPHLGDNVEMQSLIDAAHLRGMKVYFDIVVNHTGDVIQYVGGGTAYRNKTDYPFRDAGGNAFDDLDYAGTGTFPALDPAISFPYEPTFATPADANVKAPTWLNDPIYYHNRGNSTFSGESSLYGDFFGLDDLFTAHPDVVSGMIDAHKAMIDTFGIDGFRMDTVKHVNDEFWEEFVPAILTYAAAQGADDFVMFGEVFDGDPAYLSRFSTELPLPATLDFRFDGAVKGVVAYNGPTHNLRDLFADDNWFTDDDSNAYGLVKFVGNHDIGRVGRDIDLGNPGAPDSERVARAALVQVLNFTTRGVPVVYYGDEQGFTGDGGDKDARENMFPSQVASYNDNNLIGTNATPADDNFDATHPLYQTISDLAGLRADHPTLRSGAQLHRFSEDGSGIYAFSRLDRDIQVEYIVAVNTAESAKSATFVTDTPDATFTEIYPGTAGVVNSDASRLVTVNVPPLSVVVYRAESPVPVDSDADGITIATPSEGDEVQSRVEVRADVTPGTYAEVTFAVSVDGDPYAIIGVDDNAPYAVYHDVSGISEGTSITYKAIVADLGGNLNSDHVTVTVVRIPPPPPPGAGTYAVIHYYRDDGDYGDHTTGDYNDFWGLHLWGDIQETIDWTSPKPFLGEDEYGRFAWVKLAENATNVGFIVHRGDTKDGTNDDRFFNPAATPQIWLRQDDATTYTNQASAQGFATIHYRRADGIYTDWGLHLWGDAIAAGVETTWDAPRPYDGIDDYGAYWNVPIKDANQPLNYIIHKPSGDSVPDTREPGGDRSFIPAEDASVWVLSGDETIYAERGEALGYATIHYHRPAGDYGDYTSSNFNDFWGLHTWGDADDPGWTTPRKPARFDMFGPVFEVPLNPPRTTLNYILHRGDEKDPGPDQSLLVNEIGFEVWQLQGADPADPYLLPMGPGGPVMKGNLSEQRAYWVSEDTILWAAADDSTAEYRLYYAASGGLALTDEGVSGDSLVLTLGTADPAIFDKFPHLTGLPALKIAAGDLDQVPDILTGQFAVGMSKDNSRVDATGLQIPGVLDDLYTYNGDLGVTWNGNVPTIRLWAPTAKSVTFHLFDDADPTTTSTTTPMALDADFGVWSITGDASWKNKYYLFDVEVYVNSTGQVEHNLVTDPYSFSLAMNSIRSQIVDLSDPALKPPGWDSLAKPPVAAPEDISVYEIHVRDFSVNDPLVPDDLKGTYKAFTLDNTHGMNHLKELADAGLTYLHLLPVFDIATIDENKANWQEPDPDVLATYPPDSDQQQAAVVATENLDGFNWGYDPFHYTTPEGSYSTDPDGTTRILEFREMVQSLNEDVGLRVVMDVVYNHTNASGQSEKSVLDRIVPGYYHRLNNTGGVENSTCCANTASEHNMMEKLMVDSLVVWAAEYKVDAFRFDLMGHHMVENMVAVQEALQGLTTEDDGVDGAEIYLYGEGWNFGEVANNARGINATQLNMAGTGIGTFSDRLRDAVRGGGPFDGGQDLIRRQGFANGLYYDPNALNSGSPAERNTLLLLTDQIRVGMAGNLATYQFTDRNGNLVTGAQVDYNGQPAGYTLDPQENISYISKHDNQTLYDINAYKLPVNTAMDDRVRAQNVGLSTVILGQGVPFLHAGSDLLRSKSMDRDSYNSGDWFNRLDFTYQSNNWGVGLPVAEKNQDNWGIIGPLLANRDLKPESDDIMLMAELFQELLAIRDSSPLFRLETADEIQERLVYHNTGPTQLPGLIVMSLSDLVAVDLDRYNEFIVVLVNANDEAQSFTQSGLVGVNLDLHPVQAGSVDPVVKTSSFDIATGTFEVPGRTTAVFVLPETPANLVVMLNNDVQDLVDNGQLSANRATVLFTHLNNALRDLNNGKPAQAISQLQQFIRQVENLVRQGSLSSADGAALIEEAEIIIAEIRAGN